MLANPVEIDSQRVCQFAHRSHHSGRGVEVDELQFAQFGWNFYIGTDLWITGNSRFESASVLFISQSQRSDFTASGETTNTTVSDCSISPPSRASHGSPGSMSWRSRIGAKPRSSSLRACSTNGEPRNVINQTSQSLPPFALLAVSKTLMTDNDGRGWIGGWHLNCSVSPWT